VFPNSEVEPQLAVNPLDPTQAVAVWQQDRFRSVGGARALFFSVTGNGSDPGGASWSPPAAIPGFDATATGTPFQRYTDPWVSIGPDGKVYATALALTPDGPFPGDTASLVITGTITGTGSSTSISWNPAGPTTLIRDTAPPGTDPIDLANDKEMVVADPNIAGSAYVIWDRLNHPSDQQNFNAFHGVPFREDAMFARTTDGGVTWDGGSNPPAVAGYPASDLTSFQANVSAFGNQIVVEPDRTLVDVFTHSNGSGKQEPQADQSRVGVMRSTDHGQTWSTPITGPGIEVIPVTDPDTGATVRDGDPLLDVAVDPNVRDNAHPNGGNLYAVWADGRFSNFAHDDIAFSMSTDGGLTWSDPIKINQTTGLTDADRQAFTPSVAVNSDGTVAVTYYDFRNNTATDVGATTDYWLVHASGSFTSPGSWTLGEKRLTDKSFNIENAAPTSRGYFLGDYEGLRAAGNNFYALFAQAGASTSDPSDIWFRDPPPAGANAGSAPGSAAVSPSDAPPVPGMLPLDELAAPWIGAFATPSPQYGAAAWSAVVSVPPARVGNVVLVALPAAAPADSLPSGATASGDPAVDAVFSDGWESTLPSAD
jgi:hypothetical protein